MLTHRPPVLCAAHVQYLGRGLAGYGAHCNNNAVEFNNQRLKDQHKVEVGAIPELDLKRLVSSKVTSILKVSFRHRLTRPLPAGSWTAPPPASSIQDTTPSGAALTFSVPCIYNPTHTAFLSKTQIPHAPAPRAGYRYRPMEVHRASAHTVPSSCTRHAECNLVTELGENDLPPPPSCAGNGEHGGSDDHATILKRRPSQGLGEGVTNTGILAGSLSCFPPFPHVSVTFWSLSSQFRRQPHNFQSR